MIIACYNIFNEAEYLEESLKSIKGKVDFIIVIDGAYQKFPYKFPFSTDGSLAIAKKYADKVIETSEPWKSEIEKRNQYLVGKPGDIYLVIDGHEIWQDDLKSPFGNYKIKIKMKDGWHAFPRMFQHFHGIHYQRTHYELWVKNKPLSQEFPIYPHGYLIHKDVKSKKRKKEKKQYYSLKAFDN